MLPLSVLDVMDNHNLNIHEFTVKCNGVTEGLVWHFKNVYFDF